MNPKLNGHSLLLIGLAGIAGYEVLRHSALFPALQQDSLHGLWIGAFLGIKVLGLILLKRERAQ